MQPVSIYISHYAEEDGDAYEEFVDTLRGLGRKIQLLNDRGMDETKSEAEDLRSRVDEADLVFFLVTPAFVARKINKGAADVKHAIQREQKNDLPIILVMVEPTTFDHADLLRYRTLPPGGKPISKWPKRFGGWQAVLEKVKPLVFRLGQGDMEASDKKADPNAKPETLTEPSESSRPATPNNHSNLAIVRDLMNAGNLEQALEMLLKIAQEWTPGFVNDIILLTSRYNGLRRDYNSGIISHSSKTVSENRITSSLLELLNDMERG